MCTPKRKFEEYSKETWFHAFSHASYGFDLFYDDTDYAYFILRAEYWAEEMDVEIMSWCLMPDHFHMLLRCTHTFYTLSEFFHRLKTEYALHYRQRHRGFGTVFDRRFKARALKNDKELFKVSRYIHCNPVKDGLTDRAEDWDYSNCRKIACSEFWQGMEDTELGQLFRCGKDYLRRVNSYGKRLNRGEITLDKNLDETDQDVWVKSHIEPQKGSGVYSCSKKEQVAKRQESNKTNAKNKTKHKKRSNTAKKASCSSKQSKNRSRSKNNQKVSTASKQQRRSKKKQH